jgi:hypothetical protein
LQHDPSAGELHSAAAKGEQGDATVKIQDTVVCSHAPDVVHGADVDLQADAAAAWDVAGLDIREVGVRAAPALHTHARTHAHAHAL